MMNDLLQLLYFLLATLVTLGLFVVSFLLHELGHALVIALLRGKEAVLEIRAGSLTFYRGKILRVGILPIWGYVRFDEENVPPSDWRLIFVAGPAASLFTAYLFLVLHHFSAMLGFPENWHQVFGIMALANFALAGFNLIPIPPLDGWKIVESWLPLVGIRLSQEARAQMNKWGMIFIMVVSFGFVAIHGFHH
ncbi:M50 family metallopeptidase [Acidithiobacillus thiooxidans]|uniref:M50 family metallopeptidase n=1 Tax=Acidithiobacillus thiooxidans TaxID=930 RepID=UPI001D028787|nr:M50 family metallopeptidase [Acidithiobacillus thiooxidans]